MQGFLVIRHGALSQVEDLSEDLMAEVADGDTVLARVGPETRQFEVFETDGDGGGEWAVIDEE